MKKLVLPFLLLSIFCTQLSAQLLNYEGKNYFINGVNIPWNVYGQDFGTHYQNGAQYDSTWFENMFTQLEGSGINCARFWLHTDGCSTPEFDTAGYVTGLDSNFFADLDDFFARAMKHNIMLIPSLWDFYMFKDNSALGMYGGMHADLIQDTTKTRSYINNALIPMVQRYANQCNLLSWEVMNEPEWAMNIPSGGNTAQVVEAYEMQRFAGMVAEAVHQNSPKMVTIGSASFMYSSSTFSFTTPCIGNFWSDQAIQLAYNKPLAYMDFYQVHYYDWMTGLVDFDPFDLSHPLSYWALDKATLIGETQGNSTTHGSMEALNNAYSGNYAGVMFWSFSAGSDGMGQFSDFSWATDAFQSAHANIVDFDSSICAMTTNITASIQKNNTKIYPNPVANELNIAGISSATTIKLMDVLGNLVLEKQTTGNCSIDVSLLSQGIYSVQIENGQYKKIEKVVVNH